MTLLPRDFAFGSDTPDAPPSDLLNAVVWHSIMDLPDDVLVRTTSHRGSEICVTYELWSSWVELLEGLPDSLLGLALDTADEFQSSIFNCLHGYYRPAISSLRNALELMVVGTCAEKCLSDRTDVISDLGFGAACDKLLRNRQVQSLEKYLKDAAQDQLFMQKSGDRPGGWLRRLFSRLSKYSHSSKDHTSAALWNSNGPIYVPEAFDDVVMLYCEVCAACFFLLKLSCPKVAVPNNVIGLLDARKALWNPLFASARTHISRPMNLRTRKDES